MRTAFPRDQLRRRSQLLFHWRAADVGLEDPRNPTSGALTPLKPLTGQSVTFTRTTTATALDAGGNSYTVGDSLPAWSWYGGKPAVLVRPASGGRTVESFEVTFSYATLKNHTGYVSFFAPDGFPDAAAPLLHWGDPAVFDVSEWATYFDGVTTPSASQLIELRWSVAADGAVSLGVAIDGGTETAGTSSSANPSVNTAPVTELWIGSRGTTETSGLAISTVKIALGAHTMQQMRGMF